VEKTAEKQKIVSTQRIYWLDRWRGIALLLMILYHFSYDLNYFGYTHFRLNTDLFWVHFRHLIVSMFLFAVGVSLVIVHGRRIRWDSLRRRALLLGLAAGAITLVSLRLFPHSWIYFGIIHFILVASFLALPFVMRRWTALLTGVTTLVGTAWWGWSMHPLFARLRAPLHLPGYTEDLVPLIPWMGVVLLGVSFASFGWHRRLEERLASRPGGMISLMGRHALAIYLLHQPVLFSLFSLVSSI
jgi:uncharacterized membrane protein